MILIPEILARGRELTQWRRNIHMHPELAFEESRTADFVASQLESYGIKVTRGVGKTGVVGTLKVGSSNKAIGLRADMDALPMDELNSFDHKSQHPGCMHGCGHDGHTVMLLAAARYLAESRKVDGTVQFIFQPAEEANEVGSGARAMIEDGLFDRFPIDNVFALHNAPDLFTGAIATRTGAMTASMDLFEVTIRGKGSHGAFPHEGNDPIMIATQMLSAWQTIISRNVNAQDAAVLSVTSINAGDSWNVIPERAIVKGTVRVLTPAVRDLIQARFHSIAQNVASAFGAEVVINYRRYLPGCANDEKQTTFACDIADTIFGRSRVLRTMPPDMGSEDFAYMLQKKPGCYLIIGTAPVPAGEDPLKGKNIQEVADQEHFVFKNACLLHQPDYDFNDDIIPLGATLFVRLAESYLSVDK